MARLKTLKPRLQEVKPRLQSAKPNAMRHQSGSRWEKLRERILRRDFGLCQPCKRAGELTPASEVDHITRVTDGGSDDESNLQAICIPCHRAKTRAESAR